MLVDVVVLLKKRTARRDKIKQYQRRTMKRKEQVKQLAREAGSKIINGWSGKCRPAGLCFYGVAPKPKWVINEEKRQLLGSELIWIRN